MDELKLKLKTEFMRGVAANVISKAIKKKLGCGIDVRLNDIEIKNQDGKIIIHADVGAMMTQDDLIKIMAKL